VDNEGKLGVFLSARRYKENIHPMDKASEALYALKPVTFRYKPEFDKSGTPHFGVIAEEVAEVAADLVAHDVKGQLSTVRYEAVNAMLLNEFLKEHRKNERQEATIAELREEIEALTAGLQKVSAQLELNKTAPQTVADNQ
jgi:Chaperone of endosialidase